MLVDPIKLMQSMICSKTGVTSALTTCLPGLFVVVRMVGCADLT